MIIHTKKSSTKWQEWTSWFAWYPLKIADYLDGSSSWVWLQRIEMRYTIDSYGEKCWERRLV
jgi:hypothetical protein